VAVSASELSIRVGSVDALFSEFDARPIAERQLGEDVRLYLLDQWEHVRSARGASLTVHAPESERDTTDPGAVTASVRATMSTFAAPYRKAMHMSRRQRVTAWVGTIVFLVSIAMSTVLDRLTSDVLVAGISQAIVVIGWVALWAPAQYVVIDGIPHELTRGRYRELADIDVRFTWEPPPARR
jgi:hypothetical protein